MEKIEKALMACENVINGVEDDTITASSALLQCLKIARLLNDQDAIIWLQYENEGYPMSPNGHIQSSAFEIAYCNGRGIFENGKRYIFTELVPELEEKIQSQQKAVNNFSTQGISVGGEYASIAMNNLVRSVTTSTDNLIADVTQCQKRLSILKAKYYDYALKKQIELSFGNTASEIFTEYRRKVDNHFSALSKEAVLKLQAIEDKINSDNPELYSQALTTCRRLFQSTAEELFDSCFSQEKPSVFKLKSGKELDVSGGNYKNKLFAVIETLENKSIKKSVVGSQLCYLTDWIETLDRLQCKGVHSDITKQDAMRCIIQTYICLGDILILQENCTGN